MEYLLSTKIYQRVNTEWPGFIAFRDKNDRKRKYKIHSEEELVKAYLVFLFGKRLIHDFSDRDVEWQIEFERGNYTIGRPRRDF